MTSIDKEINLAEKQCTACQAGAPLLRGEALTTALLQVPEWQCVTLNNQEQINREFIFKNFAQALVFTQKVANLAEHENHHPAILTEWGKVTVSWWTHEIGGLHENDLICAAKTDQLFTGC